jgi:hypothetical protein
VDTGIIRGISLGFIENAGDTIGVVSRRIENDLERFKEFIENRGQETGAWRGTIREGHRPWSDKS